MNKKFTHIIACRYNHALYTSNPYKIVNKDDWMIDRDKKFERLLYSLENQTNKNFIFYIFIDEKTPDIFCEKILDNTKNILKSVEFKIIKQQFNIHLQNLKIQTEFLITSRIDNDDEYLPNFVDVIQKNFDEKEEILDVKGCQYDTINKKKYSSGRISPNSPFITLVEYSNKIKSVYYCSHSDMCKHFKCRFVNDDNFYYIQNIHDNNLKNKILGKPI